MAVSGKLLAVVACTVLRPILNVARTAAKICTQGVEISEGPTKRAKSTLSMV